MLDYTINADDDRAYMEEARKIAQALNDSEHRLKATDRPLWLLVLSGTAIGVTLFAAGALIVHWTT